MDICKIMNENLVPCMGSMNKPEDFTKFRSISIRDDFMAAQLELVRQIRKRCSPDVFLAGTLHGTVASCVHPLHRAGIKAVSARYFLRDCLRENPVPVWDAMERITEGMCELAKAYIEEGLDGIYYAALGGETWIYTDEEFDMWVRPCDYKIMKAIKDAGGRCILHICKEGLQLQRYKGYEAYADIINWGVYDAPYSLKAGQSLFPDSTLMGGFPNRRGIMVDGTLESIREETLRIIKDFGKTGFVIGADCTLPTETDYRRIRTIVDAAKEL